MKTNNKSLVYSSTDTILRGKTQKKHVTNHNQSHVAESSWHQN